MATLADELMNDFEESGSENEGGNALLEDETEGGENGASKEQPHPAAMELDGDEEEIAEEEAEAAAKLGADIAEEDAKGEVEKMRLGGVSDVRNVARLMKTLQPVLDVSDFLESLEVPLYLMLCVYSQCSGQ